MVSYKESLASLLGNEKLSGVVHTLTKGEQSFARIKKECGISHNEQLTRALRSLEDLGVVDHTYRQASPQVRSFYELTPFGRDVTTKLQTLEFELEAEAAKSVERRILKRKSVQVRPARGRRIRA
jgi:DNA-binding HxlR family transcriptional regulator